MDIWLTLTFFVLSKSSTKQLDNANADRDAVRTLVDAVIGENDCWILPTCPIGVAFAHQGQGRLPFTFLNEGEKETKMVPYWPMTLTFVMPFTVSGHPVVTMPVGTVDVGGGVSIPVGCQVVGKRGEDVALLDTCRRIEDLLWGEGVGPPRPPSIGKKLEGDLW